jgi:hypothetical protein
MRGADVTHWPRAVEGVSESCKSRTYHCVRHCEVLGFGNSNLAFLPVTVDFVRRLSCLEMSLAVSHDDKVIFVFCVIQIMTF